MEELILVLNKNFQPVDIAHYRRAIILIFLEKAKIVESKSYNIYEWNEWKNLDLPGYKTIKTVNRDFPIPEIIILSKYEKIQKRRFNANKKNIYKRDNAECQYCMVPLTYAQCTLDHIYPKSKKGQLSWENCVLSCRKCNHKKANLSLQEAGMTLKKTPKSPNSDLFHLYSKNMPESWKIFIKNNI
jgi:5-methylcytosine-specific restriction endonuclease McrA